MTTGSNKKKIIAFMNAYSQGKSGGDMVFIEVSKRLEEYEKIVITSRLGKKLCRENGLEASFLETTREKKFGNIFLIYIKRLILAVLSLRDIRVMSDDVILATSDFLPDVLPAYLLKKRNPEAKWMQRVYHLIPSSRKIPYYFQRLSFCFIKKYADLITVDNTLLKKDLEDLGFPAKKIAVSYPGIRLEYFKSISPKEVTRYDATFMARFHPSKGIFDLPQIWRFVCRELPNAKLGIIGKGSTETVDKLRNLIREHDLKDNIDLLGFLPDNEAFSTIKASKVFVFPSYEEGFGIAPLEAQALGTPVVAWDLPVFSEVFPEGMIRVSQKSSLGDFAIDVVEVLRDQHFRKKISRQAQRNAQRFSWGRTVQRESDLLESLQK